MVDLSCRPGLETFFTPWHPLLYSGFLALAGSLIIVVLRRRRPGEPLQRWVPDGYGLGLAGVVVFLVGGFADVIWHQILDIEVGAYTPIGSMIR